MIKCRNCNSRCEAGIIQQKACYPAPTRVSIKSKKRKRDYGVFRIGDLPEIKASFAQMYPTLELDTKDLP